MGIYFGISLNSMLPHYTYETSVPEMFKIFWIRLYNVHNEAIVLSVLLRLTASDYPFDIFKHFLHKKDITLYFDRFSWIFVWICTCMTKFVLVWRNLYLYNEICIHLNEEIVNLYNSMIISKWRPYNFRTFLLWIKYKFKQIFKKIGQSKVLYLSYVFLWFFTLLLSYLNDESEKQTHLCNIFLILCTR
jgi:hypothetical protein